MSSAAILEIQKNIRRALQIPLYNAVETAGYLTPQGEPAIQWGGMPFDRTGLPNYFKFTLSLTGVSVLETGPNPMVEGRGLLALVCCSPVEAGEDGNDVLAGIIALAYPYASTPAFDGISVFVDTAKHRGYGSDGPYMTGQITVDWNIYRRP